MYLSASDFFVRVVANSLTKPFVSSFGLLVILTSLFACEGRAVAQNSLSDTTQPATGSLATRPRQALKNDNGGAVEGETKPAPPADHLRRVFVHSTSVFVGAAVVEDKLLKRPEFHQLGFAITREESQANLILELRHDVLTKYVFSVVDPANHMVLASGKLSSLGGTVAGKVAKRFVRDMSLLRWPGR